MKIYVDTVGCLKNFDDSDIAKGTILDCGHELVDSPEESDIMILNTCAFIDDAKKESIERIMDLATLKGSGKKLIVTGCLIQRYAAELSDSLPEADYMLGVNDYDRLGEILSEIEKGSDFMGAATSDSSDAFIDDASMRYVPHGTYSTYLRISEGCDRSCAYCVIPKIRGPYRSKPLDKCISEAKMLAKKGVKELILIAEDTGCYGKDIYGKPSLPKLMNELTHVDGIRWIRLMYCYEDNISEELIDVIAGSDKICDYIDIPLQHSSDEILRKMRRSTSRRSIENKLSSLREKIPDIAIRTTFITGFPGETEDDFGDLLDFVRGQKFSRLGVFTYSREEGTLAYDMKNQVPDDVKSFRKDEIMLTQLEISRAENERMVGNYYDVLIDEKQNDGTYIGRTEYDAPEIDDSVIFTSEKDHSPGDMVKVLIEEAYDYDVQGREI